MTRATRRRALAAAVPLAATLVVCIGLSQANRHSLTVETSPVRAEALSPRVTCEGIVTAGSRAVVQASIIGRVDSIMVSRGDRVRSGDLLMKLDDRELQAQRSGATAAVRGAELDHQRLHVVHDVTAARHQRQHLLCEDGLVSVDACGAEALDLESSRLQEAISAASLQQTRASLALAETMLARTRVVAPIDGIVGEIPVSVGETVVSGQIGIPGTVLCEILDMRHPRAEVQASQRDVLLISPTTPATIRLDALPGLQVEGAVESVGWTTSGGFGMTGFKVSIALHASLQNLRPGMTLRATIRPKRRGRQLTIPAAAILDKPADFSVPSASDDTSPRPRRVSVAQVRGARVHIASVLIGEYDGTYAEVKEGLREGDSVVVGPPTVFEALAEGATIRRQ